MIRAAMTTDAPGIAAIWNPVIRDTTITFSPVQKSEAEIAALTTGPDPFLVWGEAGQILGFARYFPFRSGPGYLHTVEHTILLRPDCWGRGGGRVLMTALCNLARDHGKHSMFAGVCAENDAGRAFHIALGFVEVARLPEVGFKFGRWIDLVLMQKRL